MKGNIKKDARVDLHIHSRFSDGNFSVEEIIERAFKAQLKAISITDHDNIDAIKYAQHLGQSLNLEVISGVELSTVLGKKDIHVLGYNFDCDHPALLRKLAEFKEVRYERAKKIVKNLNAMGMDLRFDTVEKIAGDGCIGRPHIADALLKEELVNSYREAFDNYIGYDSSAYVEKMRFSPAEAFKLIREAGGVSVLAHPVVTNCDEHIPGFIKQGLMGLEVWYPEYTQRVRKYYLNYCSVRNLICTGGSDCHGSRKGKPLIGSQPVPYDCVEMIKKSSVAV